jgi:hypothetical protein
MPNKSVIKWKKQLATGFKKNTNPKTKGQYPIIPLTEEEKLILIKKIKEWNQQ